MAGSVTKSSRSFENATFVKTCIIVSIQKTGIGTCNTHTIIHIVYGCILGVSRFATPLSLFLCFKASQDSLPCSSSV